MDAEAIAGLIERESAAVIALREREVALPEGRAYFVRKQRMRLVATLISERLAVLEDAVGDRLAGLGVPLVRMRRSPENPGNALTDAPLLVDRGALDALKDDADRSADGTRRVRRQLHAGRTVAALQFCARARRRLIK